MNYLNAYNSVYSFINESKSLGSNAKNKLSSLDEDSVIKLAESIKRLIDQA